MSAGKGVNLVTENLSAVDAANARLGGVRDISFRAVGAITAGAGVALVPATNTLGYLWYVEAVDVSDLRPDLFTGGALHAAADGEEVLVRVRGVQSGVQLNTGATVGDRVGVGATDGTVDDALANNVLSAGIVLAVDDPSANIGVVFWQNANNL